METKIKIQNLWSYLKTQDDEILIVQSYNRAKGSDEYVIAKKVDGQLEITTSESLPELSADTPFHLIQQRGSDGHHTIPSVEQIERDKILDY